MTKLWIEKTMFWRGFPKVLQWAILLTAIGITLIVFIETCFRVFDFLNFNAYEEILIIVAFWMYMLGAANGSYEKSQITADILEVMMKESIAKDIIRILRYVFTLVLSVWFCIWGWDLIMYAVGVGSVTPVFRIPMTVGFSSIFVGLLISLFYNAVYSFQGFKDLYLRRIKKVSPAELAETEEEKGGEQV
ncbi:MAG: TRAP transporter small permease subunit [Bacillota bacterium]|nr:TRAP transporter small permease subunit [Bacillota bacterium]